MNATMTERFNVSGALLVKLFGRPAPRRPVVRRPGRRGSATSASCPAMYARTFFAALTLVAALAQALVYGARRLARAHRPARRRHPGRRWRAAARPALRAADRAVQRPGRRDDRAGVASTGSSRCSTSSRWSPTRPDAVAAAAGRAVGRVRATCASATRRPPRCRWPRWRTSRCWTRRRPQAVLHGVSFTAAPGQLVALVGPSGAGKTTISQLVPADLRRPRGRGPGRRAGRPGRHAGVAARAIGVVTQDAHLFHDTIRGQPALRPAGRAPTTSSGRRWRGAQIADLVASLPDGPGHGGRRPRLPALRRGEAAARHRPAAAQGARRS